MKALIVDDEKHVREAIHLLVDWESLGIGEIREASEGAAAIAIIKEWRPEIIFTDIMMPGVDGCELLSWIQQHAPESKSIVISGHDDFRFVRHSMTTGGIDYILKPIDADQLEAAVKQAVAMRREEDLAREEQQSRNIEVNLLKPVYREKMFTELIQHGTSNGGKLMDLQREFPELETAEHCSCSLIILSGMDDAVRRKYEKHRDLLFFTLTNICNDFLLEERIGFAFRYWANDEEVALLHWDDLHRLDELLPAINAAFLSTLSTRFDIGVSSVKAFPAEVQAAYHEAKTALLQRNIASSEHRVYLFGGSQQTKANPERDVMEEIQAYIDSHYNAELSLQHISDKFFLSREYISRRFKQKTGVNLSEYVEQLRINYAKSYVLNPQLKISQVAQIVGYQDDKYFSRVFKKLTGCSPNDYRQAHRK
ncbi:response regulator [Paenibacillus sp. HB172176]|uniref:response regulator transcription factor n=1 Tax=Paenibacillus sp. HB172176 TaxID=2493690 RepID=UPI00143BFF1E|nr:response regulator [Paenibacillus sp. HB172176]